MSSHVRVTSLGMSLATAVRLGASSMPQAAFVAY
jgi:hypothetical protein